MERAPVPRPWGSSKAAVTTPCCSCPGSMSSALQLASLVTPPRPRLSDRCLGGRASSGGVTPGHRHHRHQEGSRRGRDRERERVGRAGGGGRGRGSDRGLPHAAGQQPVPRPACRCHPLFTPQILATSSFFPVQSACGNSGYMGTKGRPLGEKGRPGGTQAEPAPRPPSVVTSPACRVGKGSPKMGVGGQSSQGAGRSLGEVGVSPKRPQDLSNRLFQPCCHFGNWNVKIHDTGLSEM